jgi:hypothetical protein
MRGVSCWEDRKNKDSYESKPESIAGKEQTGDNPLGLDQTGRWGFSDEK